MSLIKRKVDQPAAPSLEGVRSIRQNKPNGLFCSECLKIGLKEKQVESPSGPTCKFGHGGADGEMLHSSTAEIPAIDATEPLHIRLRPQRLEEVIGQPGIVTNLQQLFASGRVPHTYLFTGPAGCGKTTLARIIGAMVGCSLIEVDAARYSTVDAMRALLDSSKYRAMGQSSNKLYIIDEAHRLSKPAWDTLLLTTEDCPEHLYFAFCTTEAEKVPKTIRTRAHAYDVAPVGWDALAGYLETVVKQERLKIVPEFIDLAARKSAGSVRQALVYISMLDGITQREQAIKLLEEVDESDDGPVVLARMLVTGKSCTWANVRKELERLKEVNPETIRLTIMNYAAAVLMNTNGEKDAVRILAVMQAFAQPCMASERMAPILLACGGLLFSA